MDGTLAWPIAAMWVAGLLGVAAMLPLIVYSLHHLLKIALSIEAHAADALQAGAGIAGNTAQITALDDTLAVAGGMVATAGRIDTTSAAIRDVLAARAAGRRG